MVFPVDLDKWIEFLEGKVSEYRKKRDLEIKRFGVCRTGTGRKLKSLSEALKVLKNEKKDFKKYSGKIQKRNRSMVFE